MKTFTSETVLPYIGIGILSGESCAFNMRLLCDVNQEGADLLANFFEFPSIQLARPWNSSVNGKPAIGSVMLAPKMLPQLVQFALWCGGYDYLYGNPDGLEYTAIMEADAETNPAVKELLSGEPNPWMPVTSKLMKRWVVPGQEVVGTRNVHAWTGRAS